MDHCQESGLLASSIKKYLTSLENFFDFILCDDIEVTGIEKCKIAPMVLKLSNWKKSFKKDIKERQWEKEMEDFELLVTPEQVLKYEESEHATKAKNLFTARPQNLEFSQKRKFVYAKVAYFQSHKRSFSFTSFAKNERLH